MRREEEERGGKVGRWGGREREVRRWGGREGGRRERERSIMKQARERQDKLSRQREAEVSEEGGGGERWEGGEVGREGEGGEEVGREGGREEGEGKIYHETSEREAG